MISVALISACVCLCSCASAVTVPSLICASPPQDFLHALSRVSRGTTDEKVRWVFDLYDLDGDGLITKHEMQLVVTAIYDMLGRHVHPHLDEHAARNHVDTIFHVSDRTSTRPRELVSTWDGSGRPPRAEWHRLTVGAVRYRHWLIGFPSRGRDLAGAIFKRRWMEEQPFSA